MKQMAANYIGEDLELLCIVTKSKRTVRPETEFDEALQEAFTKFVQGRLRVRVEFTRKIYRNASDRISH